VTYEAYLASQRTDSLRERRLRVLDRLRTLLPPERTPRLFDVGAGAGDFLALARAGGFEVAGNEISAPAIEVCRKRHGIDLHPGDLRGIDRPGHFDAITMWCVVAHVADPVALLEDALRLLRPGGLLYFHTPRWCAIDTTALALTKATAGRLAQVTDRRINSAHLRLFTAGNLAALLSRVGFDPLAVEPMAGYSLNTEAYLSSMRVPTPLHRPVAGVAEVLIRRGWFARNILDVYARKPLT
jgi:SAM-dependent methyltransferase